MQIFKRTRMLESQIDEFLDAVIEGVLVFRMGVHDYLNHSQATFNERLKALNHLESRADELRRRIENQLYSHSLLPDHRGDVLGLLESMDNVIDVANHTLEQFGVETPDIPPARHSEYIELAEAVTRAADAVVQATWAFFKDIKAVKNHINKVYFYEKEADRISDTLKREIFKMDLDLSRKIHLGNFAHHVDSVADKAEAVADRLNIYTIKRSL